MDIDELDWGIVGLPDNCNGDNDRDGESKCKMGIITLPSGGDRIISGSYITQQV